MSLQDMVIARQLVALNTWSGPRRHSFTYENQGRHTQIDYVFARRHQVTPCVRNCHPIPDFPITAWRQTGLHRPLVVSIDYVWKPAQLQAGRGIDTDAMARAHMQQSPLIASFRQDVQRAIQEEARRTLRLYTKFFMIAASSTSLRSQCASNMPISMRRWNEPFKAGGCI